MVPPYIGGAQVEGSLGEFSRTLDVVSVVGRTPGGAVNVHLVLAVQSRHGFHCVGDSTVQHPNPFSVQPVSELSEFFLRRSSACSKPYWLKQHKGSFDSVFFSVCRSNEDLLSSMSISMNCWLSFYQTVRSVQ